MPIISQAGQIVYVPVENFERWQQTGVIEDDMFAVCDTFNVLKQVKIEVNPVTTGPGVITLQLDVSGDQTINLTNVATGYAFGIIQPDTGSSPTAEQSSDTLNLLGTAGQILSTGDSSTDTITLSLVNTAVTPGSYTSANITVDAQGRITAAANGSGGGGTPGGSDTQIQYNNTGAFGGISGFTFNATNVDILDSLFRIKDNADTTKIAVFQASGITTATTRTYTFPDESGTFALNAFKTIACPSGTNPVADSNADTLTLANTDTYITITGSSGADSVTFGINTSALATGLSGNWLSKFGDTGLGVYTIASGGVGPELILFGDKAAILGYQSLVGAVAADTDYSLTYFLSDHSYCWRELSTHGGDSFERKFASTLTADRTYTLQDGSGTLAFLTDIPAAGITQLTGQVTAGPGSGSQTATIATNTVSNSNIRQSSGLSVIGRSASTTGNVADITGTTDQVFRVDTGGTTLGFGTVATGGITNNAITNGKFRQSSGVSVVGRSANSTGDVADIAAGSNGQFLARQSNALSFVTPVSTDISDFTEAAQDATGAMVASVDFQYTDATPLLSSKSTVEIKILDDATTVTTGDGKYVWVVPSRFNNRIIIGVFATVTTVSSSGTPTVQIHNLTDAVDILSTAITIDANEYTSDTAATPPVINTSNDDLATGDRIRIDVDVAGTGAKGLAVGIIIGV